MESLKKDVLTNLADFLRQHEQEILACWLDKMRQADVEAGSAEPQTYWKELSEFYYPGIIKSIFDPQDKRVLQGIKQAVKNEQVAGVSYQHIIKGYFVFRDIIIDKLISRKESFFKKQAQVDRLISVICQTIDQQVARIGEFYIQVFLAEITDFQLKQQSLSYRIPEIIYSYSPEHGFTFVSHAIEKLLGAKPTEFYHQDFQVWLEYIHPQDREKVLSNFKQQRENKKEAEYEYRMLRRDKKSVINVVNRSAAIYDNNGDLITIDGIIIYITQMKKMEHQLRMRNKQLELMGSELRKANQRLMEIDQRKSELVNIVAHDLRNPLNSIRMFIELLLKYENSPLENEEFLHKIEQESLRLINLIDNFLDIEKIETGRMRYKHQSVELSGLIEHFVSIYHWEAEKKGIVLNSEDFADIPKVIGDKHRISQVLSNLLVNAIRYTPSGGSISIQAKTVAGTRMSERLQPPSPEKPHKHVKISIKDTGPGINPEFHKHIFDKFYQLYSPAVKSNTGTGLGLAIVKEIVEHHRGRVWVESEEGKGATFFFTLPIKNA